MTHHDGDTIVPPGPLQQRVLIGRVNYLHRPDRPAEEGDTFEVMGATFEVTDVTERTVADIDQADRRQEDAISEQEYRQRIETMDPDFEWAEDSTLYRYAFGPMVSTD